MICADSEFADDVAVIGVTAAELAPVRFWRAEVPFDPAAPTSGEPLLVYGNHGRWIVDCPCGGAQFASQSDPRFMCVECGNAYQDGAWRPIIWPDDHAEIGALLDERPTTLANYAPGETLADIQAENDLLAEVESIA